MISKRLAVIPFAVLAAFGTSYPAAAEQVGVAAAVEPDAISSLSGAPNKQLNMGKSIFYNERINTTTSGLVQVLLVDGSTFTVGPNSNLVIDRFVYDPRKKSGEMVATFSKGTLRFIGGKLSKNADGVKVNIPSGSLAIRGGMFQGNTAKQVYSFLYGDSLTYNGRYGQATVYEPRNTLDLAGGAANVRPTTAQDTNLFQQALSGRGTAVAIGQQSEQQSNQPPLTETVSLQELISDATATAIDNTLKKEETRQAQADPGPTEQPAPPPICA